MCSVFWPVIYCIKKLSITTASENKKGIQCCFFWQYTLINGDENVKRKTHNDFMYLLYFHWQNFSTHMLYFQCFYKKIQTYWYKTFLRKCIITITFAYTLFGVWKIYFIDKSLKKKKTQISYGATSRVFYNLEKSIFQLLKKYKQKWSKYIFVYNKWFFFQRILFLFHKDKSK